MGPQTPCVPISPSPSFSPSRPSHFPHCRKRGGLRPEPPSLNSPRLGESGLGRNGESKEWIGRRGEQDVVDRDGESRGEKMGETEIGKEERGEGEREREEA